MATGFTTGLLRVYAVYANMRSESYDDGTTVELVMHFDDWILSGQPAGVETCNFGFIPIANDGHTEGQVYPRFKLQEKGAEQ